MVRHVRIALSGLLLTAVALLACKGGSVEGKYDVDKPSMKKAVEDKIAKMPAEEQDTAKLGLAMVDMLEMSVELKKDNVAVVTMGMPAMGKDDKPTTKTRNGKWTKQDDKVTITVEEDMEPLKCTHSGDKLTCAGDDDMEFVLKKAK